MSDKTISPLNLGQQFTDTNASNLIQQIKSVGNQPRLTNLSPNTIAATRARSLSTPAHVQSVRASLSRTSDVTTKVTVTFKRDPSDSFFASADVYVSGYKSNSQPVKVGSGQSPISFALENTGEPVSVIVQSVGNLGPAPLSTAPNATVKLDKTNLVTVATTAGNGTTPTSTSGIPVPTKTPRTGDVLVYNLGADSLWQPGMVFQRYVHLIAQNNQGNAASGGINVIGATNTLGNILGGSTASHVTPTATEGYGIKLTSTAGASTNINNGLAIQSVAAGQACYGYATMRRFVCRANFQTTANVRWWVGMFDDTAAARGSTDTPTTNYFGFRFSSGTDTHWQAVCGQSAVLQTVVDTGISVDTTNSQLFEVAKDGTNYYFYIDSALVATISSNLPSTTGAGMPTIFGDNKNSANANVFIFQYMALSMR